MAEDKENESKSIEELSVKLKDIYKLMQSKQMYRKDINKLYNISLVALNDLSKFEEKDLEPDSLQLIVDKIKETRMLQNVGANLSIGTDILRFIRKNVGVKFDKDNYEKEHYEKFYKEAQKIWLGVASGKQLEEISIDSKMAIEDVKEIFYKYSRLINILKHKYKNASTKSIALEEYKKKYFLDDYIIEYIKSGKSNKFIDDTLNPIIDKEREFLKGGEHEQ